MSYLNCATLPYIQNKTTNDHIYYCLPPSIFCNKDSDCGNLEIRSCVDNKCQNILSIKHGKNLPKYQPNLCQTNLMSKFNECLPLSNYPTKHCRLSMDSKVINTLEYSERDRLQCPVHDSRNFCFLIFFFFLKK